MRHKTQVNFSEGDYDNMKEDLIMYATKNMYRYCKDSTIDKVIDLLDKELDFDEIADYSWDKYGD
jgi:hypothetical protein